MKEMTSEDTLRQFIQEAREKKYWSLSGVAGSIGRSKQLLSNIETGKIIPTPDVLIQLHEALTPADDPERDATLTLWLLKWLEAKITDGIKDENRVKRVKGLLNKLSTRVSRTRAASKQGLRTLADFPHAFYPMKAVFGDRRELRPKTRADIFVESVSITDLMFFHHLGFADSVPIVSDKLFMLMDEDYLQREFGQCNLLVVGSPAVNLVSRKINAQALFRFVLSTEVKEFEAALGKVKDINVREYLRVFWDMAQNPGRIDLTKYEDSKVRKEVREHLAETVRELLGTQSAEVMAEKFRAVGMIDPANGYVRAQARRLDNDFALISLARNPFAQSGDYVAIMVGGLSGPGTAHALRALSRGSDFEQHPYGGILEVELNQHLAWPDRFEKARWLWQTEEYTPKKLIDNLKNVFAQPRANSNAAFSKYTEEEIKDSLDFIRHLAGLTDEDESGPR